jgi:transglutaminase-like putative cysteine protease
MPRFRLFAALFVVFFVSLLHAQNADQRHFQFHYKFSVRNVPTNKPMRIWFPRAVSDEYQTVSVTSVQSDLPVKRTRTAEYADELFYAESKAAKNSEYSFDVTYDVVRREHKADLATVAAHPATGAALNRYLEADKLVPITGLPAQIAAQQVQGKSTTLEKARALYDYTLANMKYDKTGTGWGRGDTLWACDAKRGNCTDFHSLFISMARSQKIPARFEIGFPLPKDKHDSQIPGYHCWAEFYDGQHGWVPVDISEAWKDQNRRERDATSPSIRRKAEKRSTTLCIRMWRSRGRSGRTSTTTSPSQMSRTRSLQRCARARAACASRRPRVSGVPAALHSARTR